MSDDDDDDVFFNEGYGWDDVDSGMDEPDQDDGHDADVEEEADDHGGAGEDARPRRARRPATARQQGARKDAARHTTRWNLEHNLGPDDAVVYGYMTELYSSPRFKILDAGYRMAVCVGTIMHYLDALDEPEDEEEVLAADPPFQWRDRKSEAGKNEAARSRRHSCSARRGGPR